MIAILLSELSIVTVIVVMSMVVLVVVGHPEGGYLIQSLPGIWQDEQHQG